MKEEENKMGKGKKASAWKKASRENIYLAEG